MSILKDVAGIVDDANDVLEKVSPWWDVVEPLVMALEDGHISKDEIVLMAKAAMLRATEERLKAELP
jgi:hypothetical protein